MEVDNAGKEDAQKAAGLQSVNQLVYNLQPDLSVAVNRTHKKHFFQSQQYSAGQRSICILNSGADYIDTSRSWFSFNVNIDQQPGVFAHFGKNGSACNLIDSITISTRSGDELTRLTDFGVYSNMMIPLKYSEEWLKNQGSLMGYGGYVAARHYTNHEEYVRSTATGVILDPSGTGYKGQYDVNGNSLLSGPALGVERTPANHTYRGDGLDVMPWGSNPDVTKFCIPMYVLSEFFNYGRLIPAMIMSGLRIEIEWADPAKAFFGVREGFGVAMSTENGQSAAVEHDPISGLTASNYKMAYVDKQEHFNTSSGFYYSNGSNVVSGKTNQYSGYERVTPIVSYVITDPTFTLCSVQLSDSIQRALNEQSATNGLEIVYNDYERTESAYNGAAVSTHTEIRKSCSRALKAIARVRCTRANTEEGKKDSFRGEQGFPYLEYQWQLGSLYFPQQPVKGKTPEELLPEAYAYTLEAVNKFQPGARGCAVPFRSNKGALSGAEYESNVYIGNTRWNHPISYGHGHSGSEHHEVYTPSIAGALSDKWLFPGQPGSYANDQHTLACSLERSSLFNLAGVPVNNSRVLALRTVMTPTSKEATQNALYDTNITHASCEETNPVSRRVLTIFLQYVKLARVFLNNVEIEQ